MIELLQSGYNAATDILHFVPNWLITAALLSAGVVIALIVTLMRRPSARATPGFARF